jgi:hypothetical protein
MARLATAWLWFCSVTPSDVDALYRLWTEAGYANISEMTRLARSSMRKRVLLGASGCRGGALHRMTRRIACGAPSGVEETLWLPL